MPSYTIFDVLAQIHGMFEVYPDLFHAYTYVFVSFATTWLAGVAIYGAPSWANMS